MKNFIKGEIHPEGKIVATPDQLIELLKSSKSIYFVIIQGKSGSGKTRLILRIDSICNGVLKLSYEKLVYSFVDAIKSNKKNTFYNYINFLSKYQIIGIEDVDFLKGKSATQEYFSNIINKFLRSGIHVLVTGIKLEESVPPLLSGVKEGKFIWIYM